MALGAPLRDRLARLGDGARPPALVFECSYVNGLSAIRSLAHISVPVAAFDHRRTALGLRSRLAVPAVCPPPSESERFAEFLGEVCEAIGRPAVAFPTHDDYLVAVNASPHTLLLPFGPPELIDRIQAKRFQYDAAERAGVPLPQTFYPATEAEAVQAAEEIRYPAVMKPSLGSGFKQRFGRPLIEADNAEHLVEAYRQGAPYAPMLQERIPGGDDALWTVGSYVDASGRDIGVFCGS